MASAMNLGGTAIYIVPSVNEGAIFDILSSFPNYIELESAEKIKEIFVELCGYYDSGVPENDIMLQSLLLEFIYTLNRHVVSHKTMHSPKRNNHDAIDKTIEYINANLTADLSLKALCERVNFTPVYFHKLFKASTGKTLQKYVEEQRLKKAISLILAEEMTLTQIAYECGFSSQSYFSYVFKRYTGQTPRDYAKNTYLEYEKLI